MNAQVYFVGYILITFHIVLRSCNNDCSKTICNPRAGDLLIGRESFLLASSTCGLSGMDHYCIVTTGDSDKKQKCDACYSKDPYQTFSSSMSHRIENVVSRLPQDPKRWWQSANGIHNVSIEISFESEFQFIFTLLRFKTYRPAAMYIERSKNYGRTWEKYAYFSDNCKQDFPSVPERKRNNIDEVMCSSEFSSIIPSEGGTVLFSADTSDWDIEGSIWNKKRNDFTAITNLRIQFVRLHTFGDWLIDNNPNVKQKYYYALFEWIIRGRCSCYGHASKCKAKEGQGQIKEMVYGVCECQHNTVGQHCEKCADFYNDKPWLPAEKNSTNECRKCNCNNHAVNCHFNPLVYKLSENVSGGVCDNCQHNTESQNCERCKSGYFRNSEVPITSEHTCLKCQCDSQGTKFPQLCVQEIDHERNLIAGSCICKENVEGIYCNKCKTGFWNFSGKNENGCTSCNCLMIGTIGNQGCDLKNGSCYCKPNVLGHDCSTCKNGFYNLSSSNPNGCLPCQCKDYGSLVIGTCDKYSGQCFCKKGYMGKNCNEIKPEWYVDILIHSLRNGRLKMNLPPVPTTGYYNFIITMDTQEIQLIDFYVIKLIIAHDENSHCQSYEGTIKITKGTKFIIVPNKCLEKNLPISLRVFVIKEPTHIILYPSIVDIVVVPMLDVNDTKTTTLLTECLKYNSTNIPKTCEFTTETSSHINFNNEPQKCNCNVTGSINNFCNKIGGQCSCLTNVIGKVCDRCAPGSYGFDARGCKECNCDVTGSLNLQCSNDTGKCQCKDGFEGQRCEFCKSGFWNYPSCKPCKCHSMSDTCDKKTGRCLECRKNSFGNNCEKCIPGYYGDPTRGISCLKCNCPGLLYNRNNSVGCALIYNSSYFCMCKPGYTGQFCERCEINHFGNPLSKNGVCRPCNCSGNINTRITGSCDVLTGKCTKCLYNTAGFNCEQCADGYFGNGITRTCKKCVCNKLGTNLKTGSRKCDHETGQCPCLYHVIGTECNKCQDNFYNISSEIGCSSCQCDYPIGSISRSCNQLTGQCQCRSTRGGIRCDKCEDGFWGNPGLPNGCKACRCHPKGSLFSQCDRNVGTCQCKPGITGKYCDRCSKGTDGKMPNCTPCGDCWLQWDENIQHLEKATESLINRDVRIRSNTKYPREINRILLQLHGYVNSTNSIIKIFPPGFINLVDNILLKLKQLKSTFENINVSDVPYKQLAISNLTNKINSARSLVNENIIRDFGGYTEIVELFHIISAGAIERNKLFQKLNLIRQNFRISNEDLREIKIEDMENRFRELNGLIDILTNNLKLFNDMTCDLTQNNSPINCFIFCGVFVCQPEICFRNSSIDPFCTIPRSNFFNLYSRFIDQKNFELDLKTNSDYLNDLYNKNIRKSVLKAEEDYSTTIQLIGVTNSTIESSYSAAEKLMNKLNNDVNGSINEKDFKILMENISNFDLSSNEEKIKKMDEEISKRKKKLTNVDSILEKSKDNRNTCENLKKEAFQAKEDANHLLKTIINNSNIYGLTNEFQRDASNLLLNFSVSLNNRKKDLEAIMENQKQIEKKQRNIIEKVNNNVLIKSKFARKISDFQNLLDRLTSEQAQISISLKELKKKLDLREKKQKELKKQKSEAIVKLNDKFYQLFNKINVSKEQILLNSAKLSSAEKIISDKELRWEQQRKLVEDKLIHIENLQNRIYLKSEYHAKCLP